MGVRSGLSSCHFNEKSFELLVLYSTNWDPRMVVLKRFFLEFPCVPLWIVLNRKQMYFQIELTLFVKYNVHVHD